MSAGRELGAARPPAWLAAVVEGAGALLWWHAETGEAGAHVWDEARAAGWLDAVWTVGETGALDPGPLEPFARDAALASWQEAWWPASRSAGIAPLDPRELAARRVVALAALDGCLDDDRATERALADLAGATAAHGPIGGDLGARVAEVADEFGVALPEPRPAARREDYALAAAGPRPGAPLASGSSPVDPGAVPQGVADPFGRIAWSVAAGQAGLELEVTVGRAPAFGDPDLAPAPALAALTAVVAGVEVPLAPAGEVWRGVRPAPPELLALPTDRREATLRAEGFAPIPGVDASVLARIAGAA